ncbi:MAG: hypothetical protein Q8R96_05820 [Bacteroidota bacterium]|nr:hypothetical protein [Bacteroidota bacterium]
MNRLTIFSLKLLRKLYSTFFGSDQTSIQECEQDPNKASLIIYEALIAEGPCMIARFGGFELATVVNYLGIKRLSRNTSGFIKGETPAWWWEDTLLLSMHTNAGFFPMQIDKVEKFCQLMITDIPLVDILGSWLPNEHYFKNELNNCKRVNFELLNPYFSSIPWTKALEGKKILVVHPFAKTIAEQYKKRDLIFLNNLLPEFELKTIKAVQSIAGKKTNFNDWFEALEYMKTEIDKHDYDICLIGCGAYGFPLAAHVKRREKKAVHLGGSLQLLFGIRGKRWEDETYNSKYNYANLMNEYWVKPNKQERPNNAALVEDACYW